jgi:hypothetical protein
MTRWKRERPDTLILMHAHNQWSRRNSRLLNAAEDLGVPLCLREYPNHYDGSRDQEWIVPHGLKRKVEALEERMFLDILRAESTF